MAVKYSGIPPFNLVSTESFNAMSISFLYVVVFFGSFLFLSFAFFLFTCLDSNTPIAQGEISRSVAFPTHVWKMANICKHIIVWLFSHMCAFSHTYVSKSKHVWKIAPRCKYTNVFGFFQTCWIKVKHLPKLTCVVFYTQVWLFSNIFAKSQTCVEKTIMFH